MNVENQRDVEVLDRDGYARRQRVTEYKASTRSVIISRVSQLLWLLYGIVAILLTFRFVFRLTGADPSSFVAFIYNITNPLVAPFAGAFAQTEAAGFDTGAVLAVIVYGLVVWAVISLVHILFKGSGGVRRVIKQERIVD
ncbi:MAG: YggT family protein [Anaerolineae bacterium]|nr:YggT family protein [Anaerolineae bacterium]MCB9461324.1 YggT family protein [Anaerolineaceae bacterium]